MRESGEHSVEAAFDPRQVLGAFCIAAAVILLLGYVRELYAFYSGVDTWDFKLPLLNLDAELTLASWYSSAVIAFVAILMWVAAKAAPGKDRLVALTWRGIAMLLLYMSIDETTAIHEHFSNLLHFLPSPYGLLRYGWVVIGIAIAIVVALVSIPFLRRIPWTTALRLTVAGSVYVAGAVGFEMIESAIFEPGPESPLYVTLVCIEESAEIAGMLLALRAMLYHLTDHVPVRLSLRRDGDRSAGST